MFTQIGWAPVSVYPESKQAACNIAMTTMLIKTHRTPGWKFFLRLSVVLSLLGAYFYGVSLRSQNELTLLGQFYETDAVFQKISDSPLIYNVTPKNDASLLLSVAIETTNGYGGPTTIATEVDAKGIIQRVLVLEHKETPAFFKNLQDEKYFKQFEGLMLNSAFVLDEDIDGVSGATVSSKAFCQAVQVGGHNIGRELLNMSIAEKEKPFIFGIKETILIILFVLVMIGSIKKIAVLRYFTLAASGVILGFYLNSAISLSNIASILLGYFPSITEKAFWWLLVGGALLMILFYGKNLYCYWLCPFGAIQEFATKIGGVNIKLSRRTLTIAKYIGPCLTWLALMIIFLTSNTTLASYEPFAAIFGLRGTSVQWFIMPTVILGSFFITRFWCRFFCPVGVVLKITGRIRAQAKRGLKGIKKWKTREAY
jgi:NosR/NirI family nitrous oxide reductase transcriptional regulator